MYILSECGENYACNRYRIKKGFYYEQQSEQQPEQSEQQEQQKQSEQPEQPEQPGQSEQSEQQKQQSKQIKTIGASKSLGLSFTLEPWTHK